jgi:aryl-alcohol dehydrogenase-like predicted oxidoreductase
MMWPGRSFSWRKADGGVFVNQPLNTVNLGPTAIQVSPLGTGAMAWGGGMMWSFGRSNYTEADVEGAFQASLAAGINFFDTAEVYGGGKAEKILGRFLKKTETPVIVATKFMPYPWRLQPQSLLQALKASLVRLGLDHVDLYQIHMPMPPLSIEAWMAPLAEAVNMGLTRSVGVSNYSVEQMRRAHAALAKKGVPLASNQVDYSLLQRSPERTGLLAACHEMQVTLIAYCPLARGLLTGKYDPDTPPSGLRGLAFNRQRITNIQPLINLMRQMGQAHGGKSPGQVALNWVMCKGAVPIPGAKNNRQMQENAGATGWNLTDAEVAALDAASDAVLNAR